MIIKVEPKFYVNDEGAQAYQVHSDPSGRWMVIVRFVMDQGVKIFDAATEEEAVAFLGKLMHVKLRGFQGIDCAKMSDETDLF